MKAYLDKELELLVLLLQLFEEVDGLRVVAAEVSVQLLHLLRILLRELKRQRPA